MAAVRHLGFVLRVLEPSTKAFGGLYHCAKFGWNRCSSFDNMRVFRFCEFGLKTPVHGFFLWGVDPLNGELCEHISKRHILARGVV